MEQGCLENTKTQSVEKTEELKISMESFKGFWKQDDSKQFEMHTYVEMYITDWLCIQQNIGMLHSTRRLGA